MVLVVCLCGFARVSHSWVTTVPLFLVAFFIFLLGLNCGHACMLGSYVCWHNGFAWWTHQVVSMVLLSSTAVCANALLFASVAPFLRWIFSCHILFMHSLRVRIKSKSSPGSPLLVWASCVVHFASQLIQWVDWCAGWSSLSSR